MQKDKVATISFSPETIYYKQEAVTATMQLVFSSEIIYFVCQLFPVGRGTKRRAPFPLKTTVSRKIDLYLIMTVINVGQGKIIVKNYYSGRKSKYFLNCLLKQELDANSHLSCIADLIHLLEWQPLCSAWEFTTNPLGIILPSSLPPFQPIRNRYIIMTVIRQALCG